MDGVKSRTPTANAARGPGLAAIRITRLGFLSGSGGRGLRTARKRLRPRASTPSPRRNSYRGSRSLGWLRPPARSTRNRMTAIRTVVTTAPSRKNSAVRRGLADARKTAETTSAVGEIAPSRAYPVAWISMARPSAVHAAGRGRADAQVTDQPRLAASHEGTAVTSHPVPLLVSADAILILPP